MPLFKLKQIAQDGASKGDQLVWNSTSGLWVPEAPSFYSAVVSASDTITTTSRTTVLIPNTTINLPTTDWYYVTFGICCKVASGSLSINPNNNSVFMSGTWRDCGITSFTCVYGAFVRYLTVGTLNLYWNNSKTTTATATRRFVQVVRNIVDPFA